MQKGLSWASTAQLWCGDTYISDGIVPSYVHQKCLDSINESIVLGLCMEQLSNFSQLCMNIYVQPLGTTRHLSLEPMGS
eukprot:2868286-Amphidinium_carterae.1